MGKKKMNFLFPFKSSSHLQTTTSHSSWPWPSVCTSPKTLSFRATTHEEEGDDDVFKTINSAYFQSSSPKSCFNGGSSVFEESFSTAPEIILEDEDDQEEEEEEEEEDSIETMIRGLRSSERLFFKPENKTISCCSVVPYKESRAIVVDSMDPFGDFKKSMEEMVEAHGLKDWECLQELLNSYLKVNNKSNHGYIIGAFVDLLVALSFDTCSSSSSITPPHPHLSFSSSSSTFSNSPCNLSASTLDVDAVTSSSSVSNS